MSDAYISRLQRFERARVRVEQLLAVGRISRSDALLFYEGIFLRAVTLFEGLLEDLFVGVLVGGVDRGRRVVPRVTFKSHSVARDVMLGGRSYVEWLPYHHTDRRAGAFFRGGFPFSNLSRSEKRELGRIILIRNAVAHQSRAALRQFEVEVIGAIPLMPAERTPAGYLRSNFRALPAQTRYENIANTFATLARKLCS